MTRLKLEQDIKPLSEFRAHATAILEEIHKTRRPLVITQNGRSAAVVLDVAAYDALMERMELLEDIRIADAQLKAGKGIENEKARKQALAVLKK